jgi:hypothetical protein
MTDKETFAEVSTWYKDFSRQDRGLQPPPVESLSHPLPSFSGVKFQIKIYYI